MMASQVVWFSLNVIQARICCLAQRLYMWSCFISLFFHVFVYFIIVFIITLFGHVVYV